MSHTLQHTYNNNLRRERLFFPYTARISFSNMNVTDRKLYFLQYTKLSILDTQQKVLIYMDYGCTGLYQNPHEFMCLVQQH